ncbi:MAG: SulP family sulfate permease [Bradymonadia bacterium]|jgi:SulP family sulfate permease
MIPALKSSDATRAAWTSNMVAGATSAVVIIPQGMAYALVAGVPPIHGLYASLLPLLVYAFFGRSRQLSVGPGALDTLMVGAALAGAAFVTEANYLAVVAGLALMVGAIQVALGLLRAGFVVGFLSRPVISGFTSAAAITVAASQLGALLGIPAPRAPRVMTLLSSLVSNASELHILTALVGVGSVLALIALKKWRKRSPHALLVVAATAALSFALGFGERGVVIMGEIPAGLPSIVWPSVAMADLVSLVPSAIAIAFVGYLTVISIAQTFANRNRYRIDPNRELVAIGTANVAAAVTLGFPVSASFSRSAVHAQAGATSRFAAVMTAACVALTLLLLTPLFGPLPKCTLAAIIITAVLGLVDWAAFKALLRSQTGDAIALAVTFLATVSLGLEFGIFIGAAWSLATVLVSARPNWESFRGRANKSPGGAITSPAVLFYGNQHHLRDAIGDAAAVDGATGIDLDASALRWIDSSAVEMLRDAVAACEARGVALRIRQPQAHIAKMLTHEGAAVDD